MTEQPPSLQQYPGYYPEGSKPFWTRTKVGIGALLLGFAGGLTATAGADSAPEAPKAAISASQAKQLKADLTDATEEAAALEQETSDLEQQVGDLESDLEAAKVQQRNAVKVAIAKTRKVERQKAAAAVAAAEAAAAPALVPLASTQQQTDPRYDYCYEANAAGYGPYYQGQDPEYDWYDDRDGDGIVCEY